MCRRAYHRLSTILVSIYFESWTLIGGWSVYLIGLKLASCPKLCNINPTGGEIYNFMRGEIDANEPPM